MLSFLTLNRQNHHYLRDWLGLKAHFAQSDSKTVIAGYRTGKEQLAQKPYKYKDESVRSRLFSDREILSRRQKFMTGFRQKARDQQSALRRIFGRENRRMADVNHQLSKTAVQTYGADTLFVLEDLKDVSFADGHQGVARKQPGMSCGAGHFTSSSCS